MKTLRAWRGFAVLLGVAGFCCPALADFNSAVAAYERQEYEVAFEEFTALAKIGHPPSQHNLGVLYLKGEGTAKARDLAYAWLSLAAEAGNADSAAALTTAFVTPSAEQHAAAERVKTEFGPQAIARRLLPDPKCQPFDTPPTAGKLKPPKLPLGARNRDVQALVIAEFYVAADGRAREPRVLQSSPEGVFDDAVFEAVVGSQYKPAVRDGRAIGQWTRFAYTFTQRRGLDAFRPFVQNARERAEAGDPTHQYVYSLILMSPGLGTASNPSLEDMELARLWRLKAAQGGMAQAQFMLGRDQLATACEGSIARAMEWIRLAARGGLPDAQVLLSQAIEAQVLYDADPRHTALDWLERAAKSNDLPSMRALAEMLAVSSLRDGTRALALSEELVKRQPYYPAVLELRAASRAALGQFDAATSDQRKALKMASRLNWNVAPQKQRLESYLAHKPWDEPILLPQDR